MICKNCEKTYRKDFKFCPDCGQKADDELTIRVLFNQTIGNYFSVDARFFKSFLPLLFKPGYLAKKFVTGKRMIYLHPAQYYLFVSVVFFFLFSFTVRKGQQGLDTSLQKGFDNEMIIDSVLLEKSDSLINIPESVMTLDNGANLSFGFDRRKLDSLIDIKASEEEMLTLIGYKEGDGKFMHLIYSQVLKFYLQRGGGILEALYDTIPISIFFLMPIFAFILKLLFYRKGQFSHHLVLSFYFFSFLFFVFIILLISNFIIKLPGWLDLIIVLSTGIYLLISIIKFYGQSFISSLFKTLLLLFSYTLIVLPISIIVIIVISFLLY